MRKSSFTVLVEHKSTNRWEVFVGVQFISITDDGYIFFTEDKLNPVVSFSEGTRALFDITFDAGYTDKDIKELKQLCKYEVHDHRYHEVPMVFT